jgi:hypothetical protein
MIPSAAADDVVIKSPVPVYELTLPGAYQPTIPREDPFRYVRSCGRESWARVSVVLVNGTQPLKQNPAGITMEEILPFVPLPPDAKPAFSTIPWRDLDIGVIEYRAVVKDLPVIGRSAVLPLQGNALTLTVYAPDPLEKEMKDDFNIVLALISKTSTTWHTAAELKKIGTLETIGKAAAGLLALYPAAWILFFRGNPMRLHWLRTGWLVVAAVLLFIPISSPGEYTLFSNPIVNGILSMVVLLFAARRIKMGIEG